MERVPDVAAHIITRMITETVIDPSHVQRTESEEFRHTKARLRQDGHYCCWVCGTTDSIQIHHRAAEWMFAGDVDYALLKEFCEEWDCYGYGRLLRAQPIATVDDVRNAMALCQSHHTGVDHADGSSGTGIHEMTFPAWVMQRLAKKGDDPVPQAGETAAQVLAEEATPDA